MAKAKKKQEIDLSGQTFKFTEAENRFLEVYVKKRMSAEIILEHAGEMLNEARQRLWETIYEFYPEWKEYHSHYNANTGKIQIVRKKVKRLSE